MNTETLKRSALDSMSGGTIMAMWSWSALFADAASG
jgi:hypothetical protein